MKRPLFFMLLFYALTLSKLNSQKSSLELSEAYGPYGIGFQEFNIWDKSRSFSEVSGSQFKQGESIFRPIQVCVWYPAEKSKKQAMSYEDYFYLKAHEVGRTVLTAERKAFILKDFLETDPVQTEVLDKEFKVRMRAVKNATAVDGSSFPLIIYGPSWWSTAFENALLFEFLASHGYVVVSSPSVGPESREMPISRIGVETQARDMEFLLSLIDKFPNADPNRIAIAGFSLGGLSNVLMMARNTAVDAWIGIDPSIHEAYAFFSDSPYEDYTRFTKPTLFINSLGYMNPLPFYDQLVYSDAYMVNLPQLEHTDLASKFIKLFASAQAGEELDNRVRGYQILAGYILAFLNGVLKNEYPYEEMVSKHFTPTEDSQFVQIQTKKGLPLVDSLFQKFSRHYGIGLAEYLKKKMPSAGKLRYPEADLQKLIFLSVQKDYLESAGELLDLYTKNYEKAIHLEVLKQVSKEKMLLMFKEIYELNKACDFSYHQLNHTGHVLSMGTQKKEGLNHFLLNTQLYPDNYQAFFNLGVGYYRLEDYKNAAINFEKCLTLEPNQRYRDMANNYLEKL